MRHASRRALVLAAAAAALALIAGGCANNGGARAEPEAPERPLPAEEPAPAEAEAEASDEAQFALALIRTAYDEEEELAELATERAEAPRVRAHAEDLLEDYERLGSELDELAEDVDANLEDADIAQQVESELEPVYADQRTTLEAAEGEDFDRAYLSSLLATNRATLSELERIAPQIEEPEVEEFAQEQQRVLERHLERTRDVAEREGMTLPRGPQG